MKWVYRNKLDEHDNMLRNKARLVAYGYSHQEGFKYTKTYASITEL